MDQENEMDKPIKGLDLMDQEIEMDKPIKGLETKQSSIYDKDFMRDQLYLSFWNMTKLSTTRLV